MMDGMYHDIKHNGILYTNVINKNNSQYHV